MGRQTRRASLPSLDAPGAAPRTYRWLLFVHHLPSHPSNLRVRAWRRLQQIGALAVKQSLFVLPDTPTAREDFEWLKTEIESAGGQASVFAADGVDAWSNDTLVEEFRRSRQAAYEALAREADQLLKQVSRRAAGVRNSAVAQIRERLVALERIDFFGSAGRDRVVTLIQQLEARAGAESARATTRSGDRTADYRGRLWVTRPRPGVDRMASAWLIRRCLDPDAQFRFVGDRTQAPADSIPFDMFGVEFTHRGDFCTFETLIDVFGLRDATLQAVAAVVHDLDLKDGRFGASEAATVGLLIEGLQLTHDDDTALLDAGMALFESLFRGIEQTRRLQGPRPVARTRVRRRTSVNRSREKRR